MTRSNRTRAPSHPASVARLLTGGTAAALLLASTSVASATPNFPEYLQRRFSLARKPDCTLCHSGDFTTFYSVTTPFGQSLRARGVVAEDEAILGDVLDTLEREHVDSDYDGTPDVEELAAATNPNLPPDRPLGPDVGYGCGANVVSPIGVSRSLLALAVSALVAAVVGVRRRRRRAAGPRG